MGAADAGSIVPAFGLAGHHVRARDQSQPAAHFPLHLPRLPRSRDWESSRADRRLGSRLYYEFTATVLADDSAWESLADRVAAEVRRQGAPAAPAAATVRGDVEEMVAAVAPAKHATAAAQSAMLAPSRDGAATGVSVISVNNHKSNATNNANANTTNINNSQRLSNVGNTSTSITLF